MVQAITHSRFKCCSTSQPLRTWRAVRVPAFQSNNRYSRTPRQRVTRVFAQDKLKENLDGALRAGDRFAESAASLVPASVPRGAAKIGVYGIIGLLVFWLFQKVLSTLLFLALLGGAGFLWLKLSGRDDDDGGDDDALAEAKRIMNKYR